ncbi:MAG: acetolactate synthase [Oscillospiraceae bacterium]|nr:acetolactate synthase [Oscillospiraceae bacterium]
MTVQQISVFVENKSGALAQIMSELAAGGINMRALSIAETRDFGVLRFIADDEGKAAELLKSAGYIMSITPVLAVLVKDEPGSFAKALRALADAGIDVEYTYAFLTSNPGNACMIFRVADNELTEKVFRDAGVLLASKSDLV